MITSRRVAGSNTVIADSRGMTVYFLSARGGHKAPTCTGRCSAIWHPVLVQQGDVAPTVPGTSLKAGVLPWPGGHGQLALSGRRLYTFTGDSVPGDVKGEGFITNQGGTTLTWHVVVLPGIPPPRTFPLNPSPSPTR